MDMKTTKRFPRTMTEAFGPYTDHRLYPMPSKQKPPSMFFVTAVAAIVLALVLVAGCSATDPSRSKTQAQAEARSQELHIKCKVVGESLFNLERVGPYMWSDVMQCPDGSIHVMPRLTQ
jgi:hypothetical protein